MPLDEIGTERSDPKQSEPGFFNESWLKGMNARYVNYEKFRKPEIVVETLLFQIYLGLSGYVDYEIGCSPSRLMFSG